MTEMAPPRAGSCLNPAGVCLPGSGCPVCFPLEGDYGVSLMELEMREREGSHLEVQRGGAYQGARAPKVVDLKYQGRPKLREGVTTEDFARALGDVRPRESAPSAAGPSVFWWGLILGILIGTFATRYFAP